MVRSKRPLIKGASHRAAQMLGMVNKQSLIEVENVANEDTLAIPLKKDNKNRENDRVSLNQSSPNHCGSRREKMFSNMNKQPIERCSSPALTSFGNLKNDGERISPKLDKSLHDKDFEASSTATENGSADDSPNSKSKKELPILEWSNANPPSLTASPSASILKRLQEADFETPNRVRF